MERNDTANTIIYTPFKELMRIVNSTGTYDHTYIYKDGVLVARVNPDGSHWFYHSDHLGSTTLITDESGAVVEETFYEPFGEVTSGGDEEVKLYTGQFADANTEQYYYGARYYKPSIIIFVQPDPLISRIYNPQDLNRYSYVWNNPYKYVDPSGMMVETANRANIVSEEVKTYVYANDRRIGYIKNWYISQNPYTGEMGIDYIVVREQYPTIDYSDPLNPSWKYPEPQIRPKEESLSGIIMRDEQGRLGRQLTKLGDVALSSIPLAKHVGYSVEVGKSGIDLLSIGEAAETVKTGAETISAVKSRDYRKTLWEFSGFFHPVWGFVKSTLDVIFYESGIWIWESGLKPFESIDDCVCQAE